MFTPEPTLNFKIVLWAVDKADLWTYDPIDRPPPPANMRLLWPMTHLVSVPQALNIMAAFPLTCTEPLASLYPFVLELHKTCVWISLRRVVGMVAA